MTATALPALALLLAASHLHAQETFPSFPQNTSPECAVVWTPNEATQLTVQCRPGVELVVASDKGSIGVGVKSNGKLSLVNGMVEPVKDVPEHIARFVSWLKHCDQFSECEIDSSAADATDTFLQADLTKGSWRFQLSSSSLRPPPGPVYYFLSVPNAVIAVRTTGNEALLNESITVLPFIIVKDLS